MAWIFGTALILVGLLGFVPVITSNGFLIGIFAVNAMHNLFFIVSGVLAIISAWHKRSSARIYFKFFGIIFAILAIGGLVSGGELFGMIFNGADNFLDTLISAIALWIGFGLAYPNQRSGTKKQRV